MGLEPIRQTTLSDTVVERLRDEIVAGRWPVGERIPPEQELMAQLGVARGTLREALRSLQYSGLIDIRRGDGTFVRSRSEMTGALSRSGAKLRDVVEAQLLIEPQIARLAAERATPEHIKNIEEALKVRAAATEDEAWLDADIAAHMAIAAAVDNPIYADLYAALLPYKRQGLAAAMHREGMERNNYRGHEEVLEAIKRRDPAAAEASARANLEDSIVWDLVHEARERG